MIRHRKHHEGAPRFDTVGQAQSVKGVVLRVDTVQREVTVLMQNSVELFDIPADCPIFLHGERIKLRMIQPRDKVNIRFTAGNGGPIATFVEVQPESHIASFRS